MAKRNSDSLDDIWQMFGYKTYHAGLDTMFIRKGDVEVHIEDITLSAESGLDTQSMIDGIRSLTASRWPALLEITSVSGESALVKSMQKAERDSQTAIMFSDDQKTYFDLQGFLPAGPNTYVHSSQIHDCWLDTDVERYMEASCDFAGDYTAILFIVTSQMRIGVNAASRISAVDAYRKLAYLKDEGFRRRLGSILARFPKQE